jgi:uncharacterized membrane protein YfcA
MVINDPVIGASIGLILISIGWILQIVCSWNGKKELRKRTLIFYGLGVAILIINGIFIGGTIDAIVVLNIVTLVLACILLIRISSSEGKEGRNMGNSRNRKKR